MKNSFIKILCLAIALMMLLSACNTGGGGTVTTPTNTEDPTTNGGGGVTPPPENLFKPANAQQILFDKDMDLGRYITGLGTGYEVSIAEVDGKTVLKVVCKKRSSANVVFNYERYMNDYEVAPIDGAGITDILAMTRIGEAGAFTRSTSSATDALTLTENGKLAKFSLGFIRDMKKNEVRYVSSIALIKSTDDLFRFSDLSVYALGYSDTIRIENYDPVTHEKLTAEHEDESVKLWFDHITERVTRYTVAPTDKVGYTIQMGKNEYEGCQFFLHSPTNRKININLTDFTNDSGDTLVTNLGVEFYIEDGYVTFKGYPADFVYPDAVIPYESYISKTSGGYYEDGAWVTIGPYTYKEVTKDTSSAFVIEAKTTKDTKPGLYRASLEILDAETGKCIKKANVYTYVYDVTLSDEPAMDTVFNVWDGTYSAHYPGNQQGDALVDLYNFMLEYRITPALSGWVINSLLCPNDNWEWLYNPRVTTIRVHGKEYYDKWKDDPILKDKMYYYGEDEPGVPRGFGRGIQLADGSTLYCNDIYGVLTIMGVAEQTKMIRDVWGWEDYRRLVPFERNAPLDSLAKYPNIEQTGFMNLTWEKVEEALGDNQAAKDLLNKYKQEMIDAGDMVNFMSKYVNVWVPILYAYTPRVLGEFVPGCIYLQSEVQDSAYTEYVDRLDKLVEEEGHERWAYVACNPKHTSPYQNLLLFCDGTEPETMMWTCYMEDVTGFLYWHISNYDYSGNQPASDNYLMRNPFPKEGAGDGLLFYPGAIYGQMDPIPSIRSIGLRDGIEDYELLKMLEAEKGKEFARELASFISTSTVTYTEDDELLRNVRSYMLRLLEEELAG